MPWGFTLFRFGENPCGLFKVAGITVIAIQITQCSFRYCPGLGKFINGRGSGAACKGRGRIPCSQTAPDMCGF